MVQSNHSRHQLIDSRQIAAFDSLVRSRSFTRAAERLYVTQSAVSHAIKALEQELGCQLFERRGRAIVLTPAGERFHAHSTTILGEMRASRIELEKLRSPRETELRVGVGPLACQYLLPQLLNAFKAIEPRCSVKLQAGSQQNLFASLQSCEVDFAVVFEGPSSERITFDPFGAVELRFFVSPKHRCTDRAQRSPRAMARETFVVPTQGEQTGNLVAAHLRAHGIDSRPAMVPGNVEAARQLVKAGVGVGVFAPWQVAEELAAGTLVEVRLTSQKLLRHLVVAHLKSHLLTPVECAFIGAGKAAFERLCATVP